MSNTLLIIGAGNMGSAILRAVIANNIISQEKLLLVDSDLDKLNIIKKEFSDIKISTELKKAKEYENILLAVKPQNFSELAKDLVVDSESVVISIMAGITISNIVEKLNCNNIVRCMPNLPAQISKGVSVYYKSSKLQENQNNFVKDLFNSLGYSLEVEEEVMIDSATAISGSGPGLIYYIVESMINGAKDLGFSDKDARALVLKTFSGSIDYLISSGESIKELREKVTSKGGTTNAGISSFEESKVQDKVKEAIQSAFNRSKVLSLEG